MVILTRAITFPKQRILLTSLVQRLRTCCKEQKNGEATFPVYDSRWKYYVERGFIARYLSKKTFSLQNNTSKVTSLGTESIDFKSKKSFINLYSKTKGTFLSGMRTLKKKTSLLALNVKEKCTFSWKFVFNFVTLKPTFFMNNAQTAGNVYNVRNHYDLILQNYDS